MISAINDEVLALKFNLMLPTSVSPCWTGPLYTRRDIKNNLFSVQKICFVQAKLCDDNILCKACLICFSLPQQTSFLFSNFILGEQAICKYYQMQFFLNFLSLSFFSLLYVNPSHSISFFFIR